MVAPRPRMPILPRQSTAAQPLRPGGAISQQKGAGTLGGPPAMERMGQTMRPHPTPTQSWANPGAPNVAQGAGSPAAPTAPQSWVNPAQPPSTAAGQLPAQPGKWGRNYDRQAGGYTGSGSGVWEQSYRGTDPRRGGVAPALGLLPPGTRGADIARQVPGANAAAGAMQALGGQMAQASQNADAARNRGYAALGTLPPPTPPPAEGPIATEQLHDRPPPGAPPAAPPGVGPVQGVATRAHGLSDGRENMPAPTQEMLDSMGDSADDYVKDYFGDDEEGYRNFQNQYQGAAPGTRVDADLADDWGWEDTDDDGRINDPWGGEWVDQDGVLRRVDDRPGYTEQGMPENPVDGEIYNLGDGRRAMWVNGEMIELQPGETPMQAQRRAQGAEYDPSTDPDSPAYRSPVDRFLEGEGRAGSPPQMGTEGLDATKAANDAMFARRASEAMRAGLVASARAGVSPESQAGMTAEIGHSSRVAGAQANAQAQLAYDVQNFQMQIRHYEAQLRAVEMAAQFAQSDRERSQLMAYQRELMAMKGDMEREMMRYQQQLSQPGVGDYILGGLSALIPGVGSVIGGALAGGSDG